MFCMMFLFWGGWGVVEFCKGAELTPSPVFPVMFLALTPKTVTLKFIEKLFCPP